MGIMTDLLEIFVQTMTIAVGAFLCVFLIVVSMAYIIAQV
jgi:hypothetical protein